MLRVEHLRDQQQAFQRTPQSNDIHVGDEEVEDDEGGDSSSRDPADRHGVLSRRPVRLVLALVLAAFLCVGGMRFWNYLQSYEWTDDAEIDGHLDPISTRINDTVVRVYVENTYHVKAGQPLVDPRSARLPGRSRKCRGQSHPCGAGRESGAAGTTT